MINIAHLYYDLMNLYGESGNIKANRSKDKYHIPRYPIRSNTTIQEVINYVN